MRAPLRQSFVPHRLSIGEMMTPGLEATCDIILSTDPGVLIVAAADSTVAHALASFG